MDKKQFLRLIDEVIEEDPGTLIGDEVLVDLDGWDSLAVMGYIALVDEKFDMVLEPQDISECETVKDLIGLLNGQIKD